MADKLFLRKGLLENLSSAPVIEGALSFTTDEPAIYIDVNGAHTRIGDIKEFANLTELKAYLANNTGKIPTSGLYYAIAENALMKWTGTEWQQINDTSDVAADISAIEASIKTLQSDVNTVEAAAKKAQDEVDALETLHATDKAALEASVTAVSDDLAAHKSAYDTKIAALEKADTTNATNIESVSNALDAEVTRAKKAEQANATAITGLQEQVGEGTVDSRIATAKSEAIADAKTETTTQVNALADGAVKTNTSDISSLKNLVGTTTVDSRITAAKDAAIAAAKTETTTQVEAEAKARAQAIADLEAAYEAADADLDARIGVLESNKTSVANQLNDITTDIEALEKEAADIRVDFAAADTTNLATAKTYAENQAKAVQGNTTETVASVNTKLSTLSNTVSSNYNTLEGKISDEASARATAITNVETAYKAADAALKTTITSEYEAYVDSKLQAADAMKFMGVVNKAADLPTTGVEAGWTYKVGTNFTLNGVNVYVGDLLIAEEDQNSSVTSYPASGWAHVASGYEDDHDVHVELVDGKVTVVNAAGQARGSIEFAAAEDTSAAVIVEETANDAQSGITDVKVTVTLEWGSF